MTNEHNHTDHTEGGLSSSCSGVLAFLCLFAFVLVSSCGPGVQPVPMTEGATTPVSANEPSPILRSAPTNTVPRPQASATAALVPSAVRTDSVYTPCAQTLNPIVSPVKVNVLTVTFQAYPYEKFWHPRQDTSNHFGFNAFDRQSYEKNVNTFPPTARSVQALVVENEFLRLTFLPELGGRLFQMTFKPTNQNLFYNNPVLKPTDWGPSNQRGWLAIGGMEWALPVNEHGYEWGIPWQCTVVQDTSGTTVTLFDSQANDRVRARIQVTLPSQAAYIIVHPQIANPASTPARLQFWINAQIALGASKNVAPSTEFILPGDSVFVHSTGNQFIPRDHIPDDNAKSSAAPLTWPVISGRDMSQYSNWENYLGVFIQKPTLPFAGAYSHDTKIGLARVFPQVQAPGIKLFAFGPKFCCRMEFSDDGSDYFELWGGLPRTFFADDDIMLRPGEVREWTEYWLPFVGTDGMSAASRDAVLSLREENGKLHIAAYSAIARTGKLVLLISAKESQRWSVVLGPDKSFSETLSIGIGNTKLQFLDNNGVIIVEAD